jgi:hypothetical protein
VRGHRYLSQQGEINTRLGNAEFGVLCLKHLTSKPFEAIDDDQILSYAKTSYFALQDYAVQCWYGHLLEWSNTFDLPAAQTLTRLGGQFLRSYGLASKLGRNFDETMTPAELSALIHELPGDDRERSSHFAIEARTLTIRSSIEMLKNEWLEPATKEVLDNLYGPWKTYKCSKPWCFFFTEGMETPEMRKKHTDRHDLPFRCHLEGCFAYTLGFDDLANLVRHKKRYHDTSEEPVGPGFPLLALKQAPTLWSAAEKGNLKMVEAILDTGVHPDLTKLGSRSLDALYFATKQDHMEICELLISRGATCYANSNSHKLLLVAVENRNSALVALFLDQLKSLHYRYTIDGEILRKAISLEDRATLKVLLRSGCIPAERHYLIFAIEKKSHPVLEELIAHDAFERLLDQTLVAEAVNTGVASLVELLLSTGRPEVTDNMLITTALTAKTPLIAEVILRYRNLRLMDDQLKECGLLAHAMGLEKVAAVIDKMKGLQRK